MPRRPPKPCRHPGCAALTHDGYCPAHQRAWRRRQDEHRGSSSERGYDSRWQKARRTYLASHPLCVKCEAEGRVVAATVVDHRIPHRGDWALFWDVGNWDGLCTRHHNEKTAREDGGWGNPKKGHR